MADATSLDPSTYDELGLFHENAAEVGLEWHGPPSVRRVETDVGGGRSLSALRWGTDAPQVVFLHGGGQNAHTWDTVLLALGRPALCVDLPGHGHSGDVDANRPIGPRAFAEDVAVVVREHAPNAALVVGMSLGGLTAIELATVAPELVRKLALVDVTPGTDREKASDIVAFLAGPESFESFDEILERTVAFNPTRSELSLRRGILHNAYARDDGRWVWRHQRGGPAGGGTVERTDLDFRDLWDDVAGIQVPILLLLGDRSPVVDDADVAMFLERQPDAEVVTVEDAGHSIQGDQPLVLADHLDRLLDR
ncbi:MAG TPA: alpha/beta hydrolase [Acidimicrobiales bacterium]|nr:alpha/beta hydrolase [Acidimicrobiales bacterium]